VTAYVVWKLQLPARDALRLVRRARACARPNVGFVKKLVEWEAKVLGTPARGGEGGGTGTGTGTCPGTGSSLPADLHSDLAGLRLAAAAGAEARPEDTPLDAEKAKEQASRG
jgi:hypothetical protein